MVCAHIEIDEEQQITCEKSATKERCWLATRTIAEVRKCGEILMDVVLVQAKIKYGEVDDELHDLHGCKVFLPPEFSASCSCVVVIVHHNVDQKVDGDNGPRWAQIAVQLNKSQ